METGVQNSEGTKFYAGLYLRTRNGTRFWGWGRPQLNEFGQQARNQDREQDHQQEQEQAGRPWANLADWLRVAHSSTFFQQSSVKPGESASVKAPENTPFPVQLALSGSPRTKRRMRFVWERRFIGLVIR
jgi:type II secretory pathway component PulJ